MPPTTIWNLTPHPITLRGPDGDVTLPPRAPAARVSTAPGAEREMDGMYVPVPVFESPAYGPVENLPPPRFSPGGECRECGGAHPSLGASYPCTCSCGEVLFIVSAMVLARCVGRRDVFAPGTGPNDNAIRDDAGRVVAVTRLIAAPEIP